MIVCLYVDVADEEQRIILHAVLRDIECPFLDVTALDHAAQMSASIQDVEALYGKGKA